MGRKPFGEVVDLSARGIRVFRRGGLPLLVHQKMMLTLKWHEDEVCVAARVLRARKLGFRKYDIGLEFVDPTPSVQSAITELARGARLTLQFMTEHRSRDVA